MKESPFTICIEKSFTDDGWEIRASVAFVDGCDRQAFKEEVSQALDAQLKLTIRSLGSTDICRIIIDDGDGPQNLDRPAPWYCIVTEDERLRALRENFPDASEGELRGMIERADQYAREKQRKAREVVAARLRKRLSGQKEGPK